MLFSAILLTILALILLWATLPACIVGCPVIFLLTAGMLGDRYKRKHGWRSKPPKTLWVVGVLSCVIAVGLWLALLAYVISRAIMFCIAAFA